MTQSLKKRSLLGLHTQDFSFQHIWDLHVTNYITSEKKGGSDNYDKGRGDQKGKNSKYDISYTIEYLYTTKPGPFRAHLQ